MNLDWQNLIAAGLVAGALAYLVARAWRTVVSKQGPPCSTCSSCVPEEQNEPLVSIDVPSRRSRPACETSDDQGETTA